MRLGKRLVLFSLAAAALVAALAGSACSRRNTSRVIVLGLDGMDPQTVDTLMAEGKMPNFARMRREGTYGRLQSMHPLLSPVIWTTIATGKTPDQHGIGHFTAVDDKGDQLPVTSHMRKVKALWNILSEKDKKVDVVGWWATWPAETVKNGSIVSDHTCYHFLFPQGQEQPKDLQGLTYPPDLFEKVKPLVRRPTDVTMAEASPYIHVTPEELAKPFSFDDDVGHFKWALATAESYRKIGLKLWKEQKPDVLLTYIEGTDSVAHLFGHLFRAQGLSGELADQQRKYGDAVEQMYQLADRIVGEYMEAAGKDATLIVLSDHGFMLGELQEDPSKTRDMRRVSEKFHREEGILYMYGRKVKQNGRFDGAKLVDLVPSILALSGLPPARDMPGRVLTEGLDLKVPGPRVASYEQGGAATAVAANDTSANPEIMERLKSLGYIDRTPPGGAPAAGGNPTINGTDIDQLRSPQGERNLAALLFEQGKYQESADAYRKLIAKEPKDASLHTSLAGALGAKGRYDEAMRELDAAVKAEPLNVEAYHNRGAVYERLNKPELAVKEYRTAVRYNPSYEPSKRALVRLTGTAEVNPPRTPQEKQAALLLDQVSQAARRSNYAEASKLLDQAEKAAPNYVLVYQYRANVAYLAGDKATAVRALEHALTLDPTNMLYQTNLQRLKETQAARGKP
jgi:predicted AlkP superfamily phosphohydrolase/phosphomutase/Flp pilus assembly protein TadD